MKKYASLLVASGLAVWTTMAVAATNIRPIDDFVDEQGTFCIPDGFDGCFLFVPPIANFLGQSNADSSICASVDYAGLADYSEGGAFGTTFSGHVVERSLGDGRAMVTVNLQTRNALAWAVDDCNDFAGGGLLFGNRAPDVGNSAEGGFCDSFLQTKFINTAPGARLPDLLQLIVAPEVGQEWLSFGFRCNAEGPLPNGKWGMMNDKQTGIMFSREGEVGHDTFPAEFIKIKEIKRGKNR